MPELPLGAPAPNPSDTDPWLAVRDGLECFRQPLPHEAIAIAHANRERVAPHLVQALEDVAADPTAATDGAYTLHTYAMLLLACWRDSRAWPPLLAIGRFGEAVLDDLFGDVLTQCYGRALASVCPGETEPLRALMDDPAVLIWVRIGALEAWTLRVVNDDEPAAPFEDYLLELGARLAAQLRVDGSDLDRAHLLAYVASEASDLASQRLLEPVRGWFDEGLIDEACTDRAFFERKFAQPREQRLRHLNGYIDDVAKEVGWWAGFSDEAERESRFDAPPMPLVRDGPKIGRNEPCPCGSGKKYKRCHGAS